MLGFKGWDKELRSINYLTEIFNTVSASFRLPQLPYAKEVT